MATDWTSPKTSDTHANELAATRGRDESNARMDYTGDTNIPDGTIRWNKTNNRFEIWNATTSTWSVLSSKYMINVDTVDGYHAGNASGNVPVSNGTVNTNLNADKLDGQHGTFFQARANHTGTQAPSTISPQGAGSGLDADKLDGKHASEFVYTTGGTMTGDLTVPTVNGDIFVADTREQTINPIDIDRKVTVDFKSGSTIGLPNAYYLVWTMRPWMDDSGGPAHQIANGSDGMFYRSGTEASGWGAWYKIWHAGNDGSGSGLDADLLDGKHLSEIGGGIWDVIIEDQKPQGTPGGTFTSGAWRTRDLNTLVFNHNSLASLGGNRFTLPAGTYCIDWDAPAFYVDLHQSALYNYTTSTIVAYGTSAHNTTGSSVGTTVITITSPTSFEIRHICKLTKDTDGFGKAANFGTEIYTRVRIKKIG